MIDGNYRNKHYRHHHFPFTSSSFGSYWDYILRDRKDKDICYTSFVCPTPQAENLLCGHRGLISNICTYGGCGRDTV